MKAVFSPELDGLEIPKGLLTEDLETPVCERDTIYGVTSNQGDGTFDKHEISPSKFPPTTLDKLKHDKEESGKKSMEERREHFRPCLKQPNLYTKHLFFKLP